MNSKFAFIVMLPSSLPVFRTAKVKTKYPTPSKIIPNAIFVGIFKSPFFVFESLIHNAETGNANKMMNNGFTDWNQGVGTVNPPIVRSTNLSV